MITINGVARANAHMMIIVGTFPPGVDGGDWQLRLQPSGKDMITDDEKLKAAVAHAEPDAHGQAALLLAESMLHTLVERNALSHDDAIAIVDVAREVKVDVAEAAGESAKRMQESLTLLSTLRRSLGADQVIGGG